MERDWSNVFAQDRYEIDDKTIDVRVRFQYEEDGQVKEKIQRPQMLLIIDTKSRKALGKVLIAENNYNSRAAKTICRDVFKSTGTPEEFLMECGMWKRAKLLGNNATGKSFLAVENFCTRVGVKLSHATPGRARTKTIEGCFRLIDKLMIGLPGYVGADEMHFKHERVTDTELLTFEEFDAKLDELLDEYNNTPQESDIMCAYDTPNNVWKNCRRKTEAGEVSPVTFIPLQFEHLLTNHCEVAKVGLHGVKFTVAGESYHYYDESLVDFVRGGLGQQVKVWFDPESPDTSVISDMKDMEHFPARRIPKSPAMAKSPDDWARFAEASKPHRQARRQLAERYSIIKLGYVAPVRTMVADIESINRAQRMTETKQEAEKLNRRATAETDAETAANRAKKRTRTKWELYRLKKYSFDRGDELAPDKMPTPPDCPDPDAFGAGDNGRDNSNAVLSGFMQETR